MRLEKKGRDLGFSLEGGAGSSAGSSLENRPIKVQKIFQGECSLFSKAPGLLLETTIHPLKAKTIRKVKSHLGIITFIIPSSPIVEPRTPKSKICPTRSSILKIERLIMGPHFLTLLKKKPMYILNIIRANILKII